MNGIAAITAIAMQVHSGVCSVGETLDKCRENGSWLSRAMPKPEPDRRCHDRQAADEDRGRDDEQVDRSEVRREVCLDDIRRAPAEAAVARDGRVQVRDRHEGAEQEHAADDEGADDREQHGLGRGAAWVAGLLRQRRRGVEAIDHEERHEHRDQERVRAELQPAGLRDDAGGPGDCGRSSGSGRTRTCRGSRTPRRCC